ncbi:hypothetical protein L218DRAFT_836824, partial [Marasmius fiardii PR-910]
PQLLYTSLEAQLRALVVEPLLNWTKTSHFTMDFPSLVVIDGLDECLADNGQQQVLSFLSLAMTKNLPLRFLICSRPEPEIQQRFNQQGELHHFTKTISLDADQKAYDDIEHMLQMEFKKIQDDIRCKQMVFPNPWPDPHDLKKLVEKSSGQFIYPSTVIKFV